MDVSASRSRSGSGSGRRSFPNLTHLSLAPLSSRFPIDDTEYEEDEPSREALKSSYIQGKSAPTTPGILSKSSGRSKSSKKISYAHESYFPTTKSSHGAPLTKANSVGAITSPSHGYLGLSEQPTSPLQIRGPANPSLQNNDEWLHRAGLVIASGTRESKGQSWLVSRASSTSALQQDDDGEEFRREQTEFEALSSGKHSRKTSRAGSRVGSAKASRRGSRVGSRVDFFTPMDQKKSMEGYFDDICIEPDFVEKEDRGDNEADAEIQRLSKEQRFGFGGLVDRLVGWPLFNVEEPSDEEDETEESLEELQRRKLAHLKQLEKAASNSASATNPEPIVEPARQNDEGGWQDAAWLLSVASKVIL